MPLLKNKKTKQNLIKILVLVLVLIAFSVGIYFLFKALGITDINKLQIIIEKCGAWGVIVFLLIQVGCTTLLSFVPGTSMLFITLGVVLYGANWKTFLICFGGVLISSLLMYLLGRFGGSKVIKKIVGEEDTEKAIKLLKEKGQIYFPVMMMCAGFPDDALVCVAGLIRMKMLLFIPSILLGRGIGCATIVFGINLLPTELMEALKAFDWNYISTHIFDYLIVLTVLVFWLILIFYLTTKLNKYIEKKKKEKLADSEQKD